MIEYLGVVTCGAAALCAAVLAIPSVRRIPLARVELAAWLLSTGTLHGAHAVALSRTEVELLPLRVAFAASVAQAAFLVAATSTLREKLQGETSRSHAARRAIGAGALLALLVFLPTGLVRQVYLGMSYVTVGLGGQVACGGLLLLSLFGVAGLERLLRTVRDPLRYQLKFFLLGAGVLAVISVYVFSTFLLEGIWRPELAVAHASVSLLGFALAGVGLNRLRQASDWQGRALASDSGGSLSLVIAGVFLLAMGVAAVLLPRRVSPSGFVLQVTLASATGVALAVMLVSRNVRITLQHFVARSLMRSKYDYRRKWLEVIQAFYGVASVDAILDRLVDLLGRSFSARRISVWMLSEADYRYHQIRSVNVEAPAAPLDASHPAVVAVAEGPEVVRNGDQITLDDEFVRATHMRLVAPLWGGTLLGFVVLGEDRGRQGYDQDDVDLLQAVAHHAGVLLAHARLADRDRAASEIRALHELSLFCVHDLKNLAGRLSLVAQNAKRFGDNPEFQRSALRTVATTVDRMTQLIRKLSAGAGPDSCRERDVGGADLFEALAGATETLREGIVLHLPDAPEPRPKVAMPPDALRNVLLNVVTNAEQALSAEGEIRISVVHTEGRCTVTIRDNGPGIGAPTLARIFEPFHSTKRAGLGIGLYQCRQTVEASGGTIVVDSQPGSGTWVKIGLPLVAATESVA